MTEKTAQPVRRKRARPQDSDENVVKDKLSSGSASTADETLGPPNAFVSYTHENPDHKRWVAQLATDLRAHGVDAQLDQWDLQLGDDVTLFMEKSIRKSERVLLVCTPTYARKANEGEGGVGYERLVVTGEIADKIDTNKFICVLRMGTKETAIPTFAKTRLYIDFTDDETYDVSLEELLRAIHQTPVQPKPPIGANPFKDGEQPSFAPTQLADRKPPVEATSDIEQLYSRATRLLRDKDLVGWKQLIRNVRKSVPQNLLAWRQDAEVSLRDGQNEWKRWFEMIHGACREAAPLMLLALSAIDSEIEGLADQRGFLDDFVNIPEWQRGGRTLVIEAPFGVAYVYHNIVGSFLVSSSRHVEAIRLLRTNIPISVGSSHVGEIWQSPDMMGCTESLGHKITDGWKFLHAVWENQPWLSHFFVRREELYVGFRAYLMLAGVLELAQFVSRGSNISQFADSQHSYNSVPPLCFTPISNFGDVPPPQKLLSMAIPDRGVLDQIAREFDADLSQLCEAWPHFYASWLTQAGQLFGHRFSIILANDQEQAPLLP